MIGAARKGEKEAKDRLFTLVYEEMRHIAAQRRGIGKFGHTMQPTVLAHEAYLFFEKRFPLPPADEPEHRETFFRTVALAMRAILKDYWRKKRAMKRGGGETPAVLESDIEIKEEGGFDTVDFLALDEAMDRLEVRNSRWFSVVMHKYFAGRTTPETAHLMGLSVETVKKDWKLARAWLLRELDGVGLE
jgi:RNA polymerase sigma factor (TIGR02999 family)